MHIDHLGSGKNVGYNLAGLGGAKVLLLLQAPRGWKCCYLGTILWVARTLGPAKQSLEAKRSLGEGMERFDGSCVFPGARALHMWQISVHWTLGYLTLHFWHPALQQLCTSQGRVCCFVYSWSICATGLPWWPGGKQPACQRRRHGSHP